MTEPYSYAPRGGVDAAPIKVAGGNLISIKGTESTRDFGPRHLAPPRALEKNVEKRIAMILMGFAWSCPGGLNRVESEFLADFQKILGDVS